MGSICQALLVSDSAFEELFTLVYEKTLTSGHELLCKEFCLFTSNQEHMILASAVQSPYHYYPPAFPSAIRDIPSLDNVTFWVVNIATGNIADRRTFENDYIYLQNHSGVHLFGDILGITSVRNQTIYVFHIRDSGKLVSVRNIGWLNYDDDELLLAQCRTEEERYQKKRKLDDGFSTVDLSNFCRAGICMDISQTASSVAEAHATTISVPSPGLSWPLTSDEHSGCESECDCEEEVPMSGIKQRMMACLYQKAVSSRNPYSALSHFYRTFTQFQSLVMWRMHFLDAEHIIIKFGNRDVVVSAGKNVETSATQQAQFFVLYSLTTTQVLAVYENTSEELLELLMDRHCLSGVPHERALHFVSGPTNNEHARDALRRQIRSVKNARNGGVQQAIKRVLGPMPINNQNVIECPYLDHSLYSYDEKFVNNQDRTRTISEFPARFFSRHTGQFKFALDTNPTPASSSNFVARMLRKHVNYIFHPTDPVILTIQHGTTQNLNIHYRNSFTPCD
ncbi:acid phosphatase det1 [Gaertneriomyces sp. JEL0708]|nr:acid phosphatase det1 [Gaertneriomyces sp. JEL0708]